MAAWSWGRLLEPIVDFSRELYVPWQLSQGKVLYRDMAYFNGPFSPYLNTLWFSLLGVSLRSLMLGNLVIVALITAMLYRLFGWIAGRAAAITTALTFLLLFAFSRFLSGNYNYVCPYSHETTHGMALALGMILLLGRYLRRGKTLDLALAGLVLGFIALTKVEILVAAIATALTAVGLHAGEERRGFGRFAANLFTLSIPSLAAPLITWGLLSVAMPTHQALNGVLGSCRYAFDTRLSTLLYFKTNAGLLDPADSLNKLMRALLYFCALFAPIGAIAWSAGRARLSPSRRALIATSLFAMVAIILALLRNHIPWLDMPRALPLFVAALGVAGFMRWRRAGDRGRDRSEPHNETPLLLVTVVFALAMLLKMILCVRLIHYGYFLAMPATLLGVACLVTYLPDWLARHGGCATVFRGGVAAALLMTVLWHLNLDRQCFAAQTVAVGTGADRFYADDRGAYVNTAVLLIDQHLTPSETVAVLPEGAMINYLTKRVNSTPYVIFMPSDLIMFDESRVIAAFAAHPPNYVVLVHKDTSIYGYRFFGKDYATAPDAMDHEPLPGGAGDREPTLSG